MKIDDLIRRVVDDKRSALLLDRKKRGDTRIAEITREVMADEELGRSLALIREDPFDLRGMIKGFVGGRVGQYMRSVKYADSGIRQWEAVRIPGQREGSWVPTRGMMIRQWKAAGEAKVRQGADTTREGRLLLAMVADAYQRGYKDNDIVKNNDFDPIVQAAKKALAS